MAEIRCPLNNLLVTIDKKFQDQTSGGLYVDPTFRPGWYATVTGRVHSTPMAVRKDYNHGHPMPDLRPGDEVAFSYMAIYNEQHTSNDDEIFYEDPVGNPFETVWSNRKNQMIVRRNLKNGKFDAALFYEKDKKGVIVDQITGNRAEIESFLGKYMFGQTNNITYENLIDFAGDEYWQIDYPMVFAVKRGDEIEPVNGYALLDPPEKSMYVDKGGLHIVSDHLFGDNELHANLLYIGDPLPGAVKLGCRRGDKVVVPKDRVQEYQFWGKDYLVVKQDMILAKV